MTESEYKHKAEAAREAENLWLAETVNLSDTKLLIMLSHKSKEHKEKVSEVFPGLLGNPLNRVPQSTLLDYLSRIRQSSRYSRSMKYQKFRRHFDTLSHYTKLPGTIAPEDSFCYILDKCPPRKLAD